MRNILLFSLVINSCLFSGCFFANERIKTEIPERKELVGNWQPTKSTIKLYRNNRFLKSEKSDHLIQLLKNGTCKFRTYILPGFPNNKYLNVEGRWKFKMQRNYRRRNETYPKKIPVIELHLPKGIEKIFYIYKEKSELFLWTPIGDPDNRVYNDFVKVEN